jgi:hypothetical protein
VGSSLAKKLRISEGQKILVLNAPEGYLSLLGAEDNGFQIVEQPDGTVFDFVQLFVKNTEELRQHVQSAIQAVSYDGLLWICYPKQSSKLKSDLHRDVLWREVEPHGYQGVSLISIDDTWSAMRFRPAEKVKTTRKGNDSELR